MKNLFKCFQSLLNKKGVNSVANQDTFCNDPIAIEDLGRRVEDKEAFFNLYVRCTCESCSSFPIYLAKMIRSCRLHMHSLPVKRQKSFFQFCLDHKVDISDESLEIANLNERQAYRELGRYFNAKI